MGTNIRSESTYHPYLRFVYANHENSEGSGETGRKKNKLATTLYSLYAVPYLGQHMRSGSTPM